MEALFVREAGRIVPCEGALSPWAGDRLHGGPVQGLLAYAAQATVDDGFQLTRLTADLFAPVPNEPLELEVSHLRDGRRIQLIQVSIMASGREVSRGTSLFMRRGEGTFCDLDHTVPPGPDGLPTRSFISERRRAKMRPGFHMKAETRWPERLPGQPKAIWFRMPLSLMADQALDPTIAAVTLSDFNSGISSIMAYEDGRPGSHLNADATMYFERAPIGEWFCLVADRQSDADAISISQVTHYDVNGRFGRSIQARLETPFEQ
ncbi:MAG: thioesterase family protein [Myxococcales bacterium]|nr:thioesterase family protein [Myxococcales bacterium]MDD9970027.1 thioesterase family protein [Myxococcales bacterium]